MRHRPSSNYGFSTGGHLATITLPTLIVGRCGMYFPTANPYAVAFTPLRVLNVCSSFFIFSFKKPPFSLCDAVAKSLRHIIEVFICQAFPVAGGSCQAYTSVTNRILIFTGAYFVRYTPAICTLVHVQI